MLINCQLVISQDINIDWDRLITAIYGEEEEEGESEKLVEELSELLQYPLNLNEATKGELERLLFLNAEQIENILAYVYVSGPMQTLYELQLVEGLDLYTIELLLPFVRVGHVQTKQSDLSLKDWLKYGKSSFMTRLDIPLYRKKGYIFIPEELTEENQNKFYLGPSWYHNFRYSFQYKNKIFWGLTGEKDAGEPFLSSYNRKGYDHYSFYVQLNDWKIFRTLLIGNYRLSYGKGLVLNNNYSLGKGTFLHEKAAGIKRHSSMDEYNYFQGIAMSLKWGKARTDIFYSYRTMDGITGDSVVTSIKKDGVRRIHRDFERKNSFSLNVAGIHINRDINNLKIGLTGIYYGFDKSYQPDVKPYSLFALRGKQFYNGGIDYSYYGKYFSLSGETGWDKNGNLAMLAMFSLKPSSGYKFNFLYRNYSKKYQNLFGRAFSESSSVQNEKGYYAGVESTAFRSLRLSLYADIFSFPWLKYGVDSPSSGFDGMAKADYLPARYINLNFSYRYREKEKNFVNDESGKKEVLFYRQYKWKNEIKYTGIKSMDFRTAFYWNRVVFPGRTVENGYGIVQQIGYKGKSLPFAFHIQGSWFYVPEYMNRISVYERGILYGSSFSSIYGQGIKFHLYACYHITRFMVLEYTYKYLRYSDRDQIGTGLETIFGPVKKDMQLQCRIKF